MLLMLFVNGMHFNLGIGELSSYIESFIVVGSAVFILVLGQLSQGSFD